MRFSRIFYLAITLLVIGLIFISISSPEEALNTTGDKFYFIKRQSVWAIISIASFVFFTKFNLEILKRYASHIFIVSIIGLLLIFIPNLSDTTLGARRWLSLGIVGIQPSEFFKLAAIVFFSKIFANPKHQNIKTLSLYLGIPFTLIILEPNMSTAVLIYIISISIYFLSGSKLFPLFTFCAVGLLVGVGLILLSPYRRQRLKTLSYHSSQMVMTISSGHFQGKGLANSDQKYRFLPKISTDSILAVIGEETGLIGCTVIIAVYSKLLLSIFSIAKRTKDTYYQLVTYGVGVWISVQSIINMSAVVSLIPLTGVPLPLISYGGSSLFTIFTALGIIENINQNHSSLIYSNNHDSKQNDSNHRHTPHTRDRTN